MLNLVFLKYITSDELAKVLQQFIGEGGQLVTYAPANLFSYSIAAATCAEPVNWCPYSMTMRSPISG